jgi:RHS repeat-associated protein
VIHYVHADEIGSTLAMTDSNGDVTDQFAYSPWGELLGRTGTNTTTFTFVGGGGVTWEGGSLYRMGARYYDARLKRWLSADPIGMAGGANLYLYASANPLFWVDLLGLCGESAEAYYDRQPVLSAAPAIRYGRYAELTATVSAGKMEQAQAMTLGSGFNPGASYAQEVAIQNSANLWSAPMAEMASAAMIAKIGSWFGRAAKSIPPLRQQYINEVRALEDVGLNARAAGQTTEDTARMLQQMRRDLGVKYKDMTPADELARITARNVEIYGDPLGPTVDWFRANGKTWEQIIESAARPGGKDLGY